jgi:hypothetical protein
VFSQTLQHLVNAQSFKTRSEKVSLGLVGRYWVRTMTIFERRTQSFSSGQLHLTLHLKLKLQVIAKAHVGTVALPRFVFSPSVLTVGQLTLAVRVS